MSETIEPENENNNHIEVAAPPLSESTDRDLTERELVELYIGPNAEKFLSIYDDNYGPQSDQNKKNSFGFATFNWVVLFLSAPWFFYRKLYLYGVLVLILPVIIFTVFPSLSDVSLTGMGVALAMFANQLYVYDTRRQVRKLKEMNLTREELRDRLMASGGVSNLGAGLGLLIVISLVSLPFLDLGKTTLPDCTSAEVHSMVDGILEKVEKEAGNNKFKVTKGDLSPLRRIEDQGQLCSFKMTVDGVEWPMFVHISWVEKDAGRYEVKVIKNADGILE